MTTTGYHYTECGLDYIWLTSGYSVVDAPGGRQVVIKDIDGLHELIGRYLIDNKGSFTGKEIRFLRHEMLMSQALLAKLLGVSEQAVARWEKGKADVPKPAETLIRLLYREHIKDKTVMSFQARLQRLADMEDSADGQRVTLRRPNREWHLAAA